MTAEFKSNAKAAFIRGKKKGWFIGYISPQHMIRRIVAWCHMSCAWTNGHSIRKSCTLGLGLACTWKPHGTRVRRKHLNVSPYPQMRWKLNCKSEECFMQANRVDQIAFSVYSLNLAVQVICLLIWLFSKVMCNTIKTIQFGPRPNDYRLNCFVFLKTIS